MQKLILPRDNRLSYAWIIHVSSFVANIDATARMREMLVVLKLKNILYSAIRKNDP